MSNISDLKDALVLAANTLADPIDKAETLALIDDWYGLRAALTAFRSGGLQSYSIAGRTFSFVDAKNYAQQEAQLYGQIKNALFNTGIVLADERFSS